MKMEEEEKAKKMRNEMRGKSRLETRNCFASEKISSAQRGCERAEKRVGNRRRTRTEWHLKVSLMGCWTAGKRGAIGVQC